jgi:hypothetical protein
MPDGQLRKREVRGGIGDWRLHEEKSGSRDGDEHLGCGVQSGRRVSFVGVVGTTFSVFHGLLYTFGTVW